MRHHLALVVCALLACSARGGGGVDPFVPDADAVDAAADSPVAPMDSPVAPMDRPVAPTDNPPPVDVAPPMDVCVPVAESSPAACSNGRDDDCDGTTDCRDLGCATYCVPDAPAEECVPTGMENTNAACSDGRDNDCDGFIDCGAAGTAPDFDCTRTSAVTVCPRDAGPVDTGCVPTGMENTNAACSDGRDNDCDGYIDCGTAGAMADFDCTLSSTVTVCPRDGGTDTGCVPTGREETVAACSNRVDEDCNGFTDCNDRSCSCVGTCGPSRVGCACTGGENTNAACSDGRDNDCDGFVDCADFNCTLSTTVTVCPRDGGSP